MAIMSDCISGWDSLPLHLQIQILRFVPFCAAKLALKRVASSWCSIMMQGTLMHESIHLTICMYMDISAGILKRLRWSGLVSYIDSVYIVLWFVQTSRAPDRPSVYGLVFCVNKSAQQISR